MKKPKASGSRIDFSRLRRLATKELREILRDRRTIVTLVLMPILVYPLLGIAFQKFMLSGAKISEPSEKEFRLAFENERDANFFHQILLGADRKEFQEERNKKNANNKKKTGEPGPKTGQEPADPNQDRAKQPDDKDGLSVGGGDSNEPLIRLGSVDPSLGLEKAVGEGHFDLGIRMIRFESRRQISPFIRIKRFEFVKADGSVVGEEAHQYILSRLRYLHDQWVKELSEEQLPQLLRDPAIRRTVAENELFALFRRHTEFVDLPDVEQDKESQSPFLAFFPLMLVLMTITGAVYPAIDLTAGERERGTMEILVSAPVSRMALLAGKFVAVLSVAMLTAIFNMVAMFVTVYTIQLDTVIFGEDGLSIGVICQLMLLLFVFAGFFSAVLLGITSFARSFKEAQAYLIPLMLIALGPGIVSLLPGIELNIWLAVVPLINIVLLGRDLLQGNVNGLLFGISLVSTVLYGLLALALAARVFGTDAILSGGSGTWSSTFRRSKSTSPSPSVAMGVLCLAVLFPTFIVIGGLSNRFGSSQLREAISAQENIGIQGAAALDGDQLSGIVITKSFLNALVLLTLFVIFPLGVALFSRLRLKTTFYLTLPRLIAFAGALLLGISVWTIAYEIQISTLSEQRIEELTQLFGQYEITLNNTPLWVKLVCLALAPAVCEEFFFRGFLLSSARRGMPNWLAIQFTAISFGLFHVFVSDSLFFERLIPSYLLGVLLGYICVRSGSIYPGMLMHVLHNGLLLSTSDYQKQLLEWGIGNEDQSHLPVIWIAIAVLPILLGIGCIFLSGKRKNLPESDSKPAESA